MAGIEGGLAISALNTIELIVHTFQVFAQSIPYFSSDLNPIAQSEMGECHSAAVQGHGQGVKVEERPGGAGRP